MTLEEALTVTSQAVLKLDTKVNTLEETVRVHAALVNKFEKQFKVLSSANHLVNSVVSTLVDEALRCAQNGDTVGVIRTLARVKKELL